MEMALLAHPDIVFRDLRTAADTEQTLEGSESVRAWLAQLSEVGDASASRPIGAWTTTPTWSATAVGMPGVSRVRCAFTSARSLSEGKQVSGRRGGALSAGGRTRFARPHGFRPT